MCFILTLRIIFYCAAVCNTTRLGVRIMMLEVSGPAKLDKKFCAASTGGKLIHTSLKVSAQTNKQTNKNLEEDIHNSFQYVYIVLQLNLNLRHPTRSTSNTYKCCNMCVIHFLRIIFHCPAMCHKGGLSCPTCLGLPHLAKILCEEVSVLACSLCPYGCSFIIL